MEISKGAIALFVLLIAWTICGVLWTFGVAVVLYGVLWWGIGYLVGGLIVAAIGSAWAYRINKGPNK